MICKLAVNHVSLVAMVTLINNDNQTTQSNLQKFETQFRNDWLGIPLKWRCNKTEQLLGFYSDEHN